MCIFKWFRRGSEPKTAQPAVYKFQVTKHRDADGYYPIVCPYCLKKFQIWEAEFRSPAPPIDFTNDGKTSQNQGAGKNQSGDNNQTVVNDSRWGRAGRQSRVSSEQQINEPQQADYSSKQEEAKKTYTMPNSSSGFGAELDEKYNKFETTVTGTESNRALGRVLKLFDGNGDPTGEVTHVSLMNRETGAVDENNKKIPLAGKKKKDFEKLPIMYVVNKFGEACYERICPHCHHRISNYVGIWPSYTVALIGDTKVGKTVFLYKLGAELTTRGILGSELMGTEANPEYSGWIRKAMELDAHSEKGDEMTEPTVLTFMPPNIVNLRNTNGGGGIVLNLFDFPGEALSIPIAERPDPEKLAAVKVFADHYKNYVDNVDAWMVLFDSISFETVRAVFEADPSLKKHLKDRTGTATPVQLLAYFEKEYLDAHNNMFIKPLAAIMSKSDFIKTAAAKSDGYFSNLQTKPRFLNPNPNANRDRKRIDLDDVCICGEEIAEFLKGDGGDTLLYDRCKSTDAQVACWFALSSKGVTESAAAMPVRITEPLEWILWRLGLVEGKGTMNPGEGDEPIKVR